MRRLYSCNADCTVTTLRSYNTYVFWIKGMRFCVLFLYPSVTSKSHIRKYVKWLKENSFDYTSKIVERMYRIGISNKSTFVVYDSKNMMYSCLDELPDYLKRERE